jgi:hypothetical protein
MNTLGALLWSVERRSDCVWLLSGIEHQNKPMMIATVRKMEVMFMAFLSGGWSEGVQPTAVLVNEFRVPLDALAFKMVPN